MSDLAGCLGCEITAGRHLVPGGILHQTARRIVNHAVGRLNPGTLIVAPRDHVVAMAELDDVAAAELGPLLRDVARVVEAICQPGRRGSRGANHVSACGFAARPARRSALRRFAGVERIVGGASCALRFSRATVQLSYGWIWSPGSTGLRPLRVF